MPRSHGRTLIELLVASGLGLLILLGVGTLFLGANQSSRSAVNVASVEESAQIVFATVGGAIRRAGYAEIIGTSFQQTRADLLYSGPQLRGCVGRDFDNAGAADFDCGGALFTGVAAGSDILAVVHQADNVLAVPQGNTLDCLGQTPPQVNVANPNFAARTPAGTIGLVSNVYFLDGNGNLSCAGSGGAAPQALIGGVEEFKVYFGFDDVSFANPLVVNDRPIARSIRTASEINLLPPPGPAVSAWDFVVSVHVCIRLRTTEGGVAPGQGADIVGCPQTAAEAAGTDAITAITPPADGALRRTFTQVFAVRSRTAPTPAT